MRDFVGLIPARYASRRYPGKPLCDLLGRPMIVRVYQRTIKWDKFDRVYVATDDKKIFNVCGSYNIPCIMTGKYHVDCLDRASEAAAYLEATDKGAKKYIIIQGDEPLFNVEILNVKYDDDCVNFYTESITDVSDPNAVKVVMDCSGKALYFSRFSIPYCKPETTRRNDLFIPIRKQIGIYIFTSDMLKIYNQLESSMLENAEGIGLNRLLENGYVVTMKYTPFDSISIDTPEDRDKVLKLMEKRL
ncbi:hypothetical protein LCGC14_1879920 [marine sediment metagenome]|uniref:3-deoxy-manno-octulosonate cytidylyltransferase n=1 Tax=marine sediment metagenome TaxID=412755 RepID=A0A0F9G2M0_9ZZZZ